jgi:hypothetical protein
MPHVLYGRAKALIGLWLWDSSFRVPKEYLGARVHVLWILRLNGTKDIRRHYAGFVVLRGVGSLRHAVKAAFTEPEMVSPVKTSYDAVAALPYLENPLCGDTGSFPLPQKGRALDVARRFQKRIHIAGHDLTALDPAHFRDTNVHSRTGSPPR